METTTDVEVLNNFTARMDQVCDNHMPLIVTRERTKPVVMLSLEEYNSFVETLYLLKSPKNADRLSKALIDLDAKRYLAKEIVEVL